MSVKAACLDLLIYLRGLSNTDHFNNKLDSRDKGWILL